MSISIYKPNSKNSGSGFSFQIGISKNQEPALFVKSILQANWDSNKKQGSFRENLDNPEKNITVKFSEYEVGHIIHAMRTRCTYTTYHSYESDRTNIKFMPWEKKAKKSMKTEDGEWKDHWIEVPAFSISFIRNGNQNFVIGLEPGETETVIEFLRFHLQALFSHRFDKQILDIKKAKERRENG